jgi:hypothetical protein
VHEAPGRAVEHFAASPPALQARKPSILDPSWRLRPELERPLWLGEIAELAVTDIAPEKLGAMRARGGRSVLDASPRVQVPFAVSAGSSSVPVLVSDPTPVRTWATPTTAPARLPARERSVFDAPPAAPEERRGISVLYPRTKP